MTYSHLMLCTKTPSTLENQPAEDGLRWNIVGPRAAKLHTRFATRQLAEFCCARLNARFGGGHTVEVAQ